MMPFSVRQLRGCRRGAVSISALTLATLLPLSAHAQSNLSAQGFGFPSGQFSTRAYGAGGSIAEMDPLSAVNPASIALLPSRILFMQLEPEFRTVQGVGGTEHTTTARYPLVFGAIPLWSNFVVSLGASSLLDRTSSTAFSTTQHLSTGEDVATTTTQQITGGITDVRLASAWVPTNWLRIGLGLHAIAGSNLVNLTQTFDDSLRFSAFKQSRILGFGGDAISGGVQLVSSKWVAAGSARWGGPLSLSAEDTVLARARVPNRFGASIAYIGIANSTIALRTSHDSWSSLGPLGSPQLRAVDAWDTSIGADVAGPHVGQRIVFLRGGYRIRTLPFQAVGENVSEKSITAGLGTAFAANHVLTDLALIHSSRSANLSASEHAWTVSFGIAVRP
jgi:hypothetical protein